MDPALLLVAGLAVILLLQFMRVRRQQREVRATRSALQVGAEVLTASGMVATVVEESGATVVLASEDGQRSRWVTGAVVRVLEDTDPVSSRYRAPDDAAATPDEPGTTPSGTTASSTTAPSTTPASPTPSGDVRPGVVDLGKGPRDGRAPRDDAAGTPTKD